MPKINPAGMNLIEQSEGLRLTTYRDTGGILTIGYGHTGEDVKPGETITVAEADALLQQDIEASEMTVQNLTAIDLTPNQFAALVSFEFNTGALASSPAMSLINQRQFEEAWDDHLCLWIHDGAGNVDPGLVTRRAAERALFFTP